MTQNLVHLKLHIQFERQSSSQKKKKKKNVIKLAWMLCAKMGTSDRKFRSLRWFEYCYQKTNT